VIVMIDNYDSFTYNLVQYLREQARGAEVRVVRNDAVSVDKVLAWRPDAVVISPGPSVPASAGICVDLIRRASQVPILGVCLGHQARAVAYGGEVVRAPLPVHGKTSEIHHSGTGVFASLPDPLVATRYHSLVARRQGLPPGLRVSAWTKDGLVMGLEHSSRPHHGVQFHPESYLTHGGKAIIANFLMLASRWQTGVTGGQSAGRVP
jgi:anthranilate synthase component 2